MNHSRKLLKKTLAVATSSSLILAGGSTVFAAGSYQDTEKAALDKISSDIAASWGDYLKDYQKAQTGSTADITLTVEDTGRALLGALAGGSDFSWLQNVSLNSDVTIKDGIESMASALLLNDSQLCNLNIYMDLAGLAEYIQIPEISEGYIKAPMTVSDDSDISAETFSTYFNMLSDMSSVLPDSDTLSTLISRYGNLVIDNLTEGSSTEETVSVEGISEDCTAYEGQITANNATDMAEQILTTARDDEEIKSLFDSWTEAGVGSKDQYTEFQTTVDDLIAELSGDSDDTENTDDGSVIYSRVWVNGEDKIIGREFGMGDGVNEQPIFTWKAPSDADNSALLLEFQADDSSITFTGSGISSEGLLTGDYVFAVDGTETVDIHVDDLETNPEKAGYYNGKFTVTVPESATGDSTDSEEASASNPLAGFSAEITLKCDAATETSALDLTLITSGAPIATLSITGGYGDGTDTPDLSSVSPAYNAEDDAEMAEYLKSVNLDTLAANATAAGVPEELVSQIKDIFESAITSASEPQENAATDDSSAAETEGTSETDAAA